MLENSAENLKAEILIFFGIWNLNYETDGVEGKCFLKGEEKQTNKQTNTQNSATSAGISYGFPDEKRLHAIR